MNAKIKEFFDGNNLVMAVIWVIVSPYNVQEMNTARVRLNNYISEYIGTRGHNIYMHTENDTISVIIIFDINKYFVSS